ncbi:Putative UBX domain, UBA-like superfamily, SEP domain, Ubiquitin-like domain superfamily [Septoria linicola]|uniref:UBX domain, UBA-like superfamily, SEP domain, Ubiquitin-like domain superfamily n=1 Tax=Septoria linicola TaxID=215465 RepID=A0A9Q9AKS8_9PEZI|nr:putative UBX domain, UBA-like superfamily, SEP domain, Ubiquitin-like domain superfamily [Septoria linicola]USW51139.1 Putative UBX domain, UBA-like superfamily, SEP domain, Ubiquitin-like domain superfamily [Septoria linicola]
MDDTQQDKIAQFSAITGANPSVAQTALGASDWDLEAAVGLFFAAGDEQPSEGDDDENEPTSSAAPASRSANPQPAPSSGKAKSAAGRKGPTTIRDLQGGGDDDEDDDKKRDLFAGGEKSGLAVTDPNQGGGPVDHFRNILNQARQNRDRPAGADGEEEEQPQSSHFSGRAQTLGGDDAPSRVVQDPAAAAAAAAAGSARGQPPPRVTRTLHLWADGVSIDDGPLLRFDDPANEHIMQEINQGRAPKALLDVQPDQEVDLNLEPHKGENYVAPKPKYKPFGGSGQRLGSPTPGLASASTTSTQTPAAASAASSQQKTEEMQVDASQPVVQIQVRLGDGTRLASRFNTTHTIGDVYDFVDRASPQQRSYVLQTTFPSKELSDKSQVLGDMSDFKRGGVVVQKWK